jgi:DNA-binding transcriptional LysR family regulator
MWRSIHLRTLQCVLVVAEEGSFLGASQRLNMHQTALSRRVRGLELTLGVTLFDRHPSGVRPTIAGQPFLAHLRRVLADLEGALSMVETIRDGDVGRLSIGVDAPMPAFGYLDAVVSFIRDRPDIDIRFIEASRGELHTGLTSRAIDMVIAHGFDRRRPSESLYLWRDRIVVAMSAGHPLAGCDEIEWIELRKETILANMQSLHMATLYGMAAGSPPPTIIRHDVSRLSLLNLVRNELGITLLAESGAASLMEGVVASVLRNNSKPVYLSYDAHWRSNNTNPALAAFIAFLRKKYLAS